MVKSSDKLLGCIAAFFMFAAVPTVLAQTQADAVEHPKYVVGDWWAFENTNRMTGAKLTSTLQVVDVSEEAIIGFVQTSESDAIRKSLETQEMNIIARGTVQWFPNSGRFQFPLFVGKEWLVGAQFLRNGGVKGVQNLSARVVGWEEVQVLAGKFTALKIVWDGEYSSSLVGSFSRANWSGEMHAVVWYVPAVKRAVRLEYTETNRYGALAESSLLELGAFKVQ